jgi:uncharacterized protein YjbI with pentapeptide repeats
MKTYKHFRAFSDVDHFNTALDNIQQASFTSNTNEEQEALLEFIKINKGKFLLLPNANFSNIDFTCLDIDFSAYYLVGSDFSNTNISGLDFTDANLAYCSFVGCCCTETNFSYANLKGSHWESARPMGANFKGSQNKPEIINNLLENEYKALVKFKSINEKVFQ